MLKRFRFNVLLRALVLAGALYIFIYALEQEDWFMTTIFAGLGVVLSAVELIRYVEKTNRDLQTFLLSIKHKDFTNTFTAAKRGKSYAGLRDAFNDIIKEFQNLRAEKESHYQYLQTVIEHVGVALLCYSPEGEVLLLNHAAKELLHKPYLNNIQALHRTNAPLLAAIRNLRHGERKLVKTLIQNELLQLAIQSTEFKLQNQTYILVSLQNIGGELEAQEIETWQKLIRVLTHEIMNSVTPIISLTKAINDMLGEGWEEGSDTPLAAIEEEEAEDVRNGLRTILSRTKGMLHFVNAYRSLTRIPKPKFAPVKVRTMLDNIRTLMQPEMEKRQIAFELNMEDPKMEIKGDAELIEQVLINMIKNAVEALEGEKSPRVSIYAGYSKETKAFIQIADNGPGIDQEFINQIFIPFFTTKQKGSGIGLSLSRQIMRMHKGSISVQTHPGEGTVFTLTF